MSIPVFYSSHMVADSQGYSPSAAKPAQVLQSWQQMGYPLEILAFEPVTREQLYLTHDRVFVDGA